jgi:L-ascorbate metabolism protein UlaG (beta-lactamase superfamily)
MEIQYYGANSISITKNGVTIFIDPLSQAAKLSKKINLSGSSTVLFSDKSKEESAKDLLQNRQVVFNSAGEYEVGPFNIKGIQLESFNDTYNTEDSIAYLISAGQGESIAVIAHAKAKFSESDEEALSEARILILPIGGSGLSPDTDECLKIIKDLGSAEIIIPTHYDDGKTIYELPQANVDRLAHELGVEVELQPKFKYKAGLTGDKLKLIAIQP